MKFQTSLWTAFAAVSCLGATIDVAQSPSHDALERAFANPKLCVDTSNNAKFKDLCGPVSNAPQAVHGINCEYLLRQHKGRIDCAYLSSKTCNLLTWMHKGCHRQAQCSAFSGSAAKRCCDNADHILPFGGGVFYTAYMRACAPHYQLKRFDRPEYPVRPCGPRQVCPMGAHKYMCDKVAWENAGCKQQAICKAKVNNASELAACCNEWPNKAKGYYAKFYQSRFDLTCNSQ